MDSPSARHDSLAQKDLLSMAEAVAYSGLSASTLWRYIERGLLPKVQHGGPRSRVALRRLDLLALGQQGQDSEPNPTADSATVGSPNKKLPGRAPAWKSRQRRLWNQYPMPRKPQYEPISCQYFTWRVFQRYGVWYADGSSTEVDLGKHSLGTRDRQIALAELRELDVKIAVDQGLAQAPTAAAMPELGVANGWSRYLEHAGRSQGLGGVALSSLKRYQSIREKHVPWCRKHGIRSWQQFDRKIFEKYGNWMFDKYAYRTCYTDLTQLKSVVNWLISEDLLPSQSRIVYKLRKADGSDTYCPRQVEVRAMIDYCLGKRELIWLGHALTALAHLGLRISELAGLRWSDIDLGRGFVRVADERASKRKGVAGTARTTKGRRSRVVPIHPELRTLLAKLDRRTDGRVFQAARGGAFRPNNALALLVRDVVGPLKKRFPTPKGEIGFEAVRFHSLRHYFCSQCFLGGASEGEIREWMGHRDSKIVELYRHLRREDAVRKMREIDFLGGEKDAGDLGQTVA